MSQATKFLLLSAVTIITCILVWLGFRALHIGVDLGQNAIIQMNELNNDMKDSGLLKYDYNDDVQGIEIVNAMRKYLGEYETGKVAPIYITVVTNSNEYTYTNGAYIKEVRNFTNSRYIPPTAVFSGDVIRNKNDVIVGIKFAQE